MATVSEEANSNLTSDSDLLGNVFHNEVFPEVHWRKHCKILWHSF